MHPAKMELRFSNQEEIYSQLVCAIKDALMKRERIPEVTIGKEKPEKKTQTSIPGNTVPEPFETLCSFAESTTDGCTV